MNTTNPVIMYDSDEAASVQTVTGWVSRLGRFYGDDERLARYDGCTHRVCDGEGCAVVLERQSLTKCKECRERDAVARYQAMPEGDWRDDGVMLFSDAIADKYFGTADDIVEWCYGNDVTVADLRLIVCEPNQLREFEPDELLHDDLPEDTAFDEVAPEAVFEALETLNAVIRSLRPVLSWSRGKHRLAQRCVDELQAAVDAQGGDA